MGEGWGVKLRFKDDCDVGGEEGGGEEEDAGMGFEWWR
jgi:hypothetical protein